MSTSAEPRVPVVLPLIDVQMDGSGIASVFIDGVPWPRAAPIGRESVEAVVDEIAADLGPVRVRVTESDKSVFTDVVVPKPTTATQPAPVSVEPGISGEGFHPEERVEVALVIAHCTADARGHALLRLPPAVLTGHGAVVVLLGCTSRAVAVCESP